MSNFIKKNNLTPNVKIKTYIDLTSIGNIGAYFDIETKRVISKEERERLLVSSDSHVLIKSLSTEEKTMQAYTVKRDPENDMLAFSLMEIKFYVDNDDNVHVTPWIEVNRFYIDKLKNIWKCADFNTSILKYTNIGNITKKKDFPIPCDLIDIGESETEIDNMWGFFVCLSGNSFLPLENLNILVRFLTHTDPAYRSTTKQKALDEISKIPLADINIDDYESYQENYLAKLERINDHLCVLRTFVKNLYYGKCYEGLRIYVTDKNFYICKKRIDDKYVMLYSDLHRYHWDFYLCNLSKDIVKGTLLEYVYDCLAEIEPLNQTVALSSFLRWPIFEKLYKAGYKNLCKYCFHVGYGNAINELLFTVGNDGVDCDKVTSIYGFTEMNAHQLAAVDKEFTITVPYSRTVIIRDLKQWFGRNLASIDDKTFDFAFDILMKSVEGEYDVVFIDIIESIISLKNFGYVMRNMDKILGFVDLTTTESYIYLRKYRDYLDMIAHPAMRGLGFSPVVKDKNDLLVNHHTAAILFNSSKDNYDKQAFDKIYTKWKKYCYSNDKFSIVCPRTPQDLVEEGKALHHCVRSYIEKVIREKTMILFLRNNDNPGKPYFTIEVEKDTIMQIHGFANCNLRKSSSEMKFITEWQTAKGLKSANFNIVR